MRFHNAVPDDGSIVVYTYADFAGVREEAKRISGYVSMFAGGALSGSNGKQNLPSQSTVEAKNTALYFCTLRGPLAAKEGLRECVSCRCQGCIAIFESICLKDRTKHIDVKFNFVTDQVRDGTVVRHYECSPQMAAHMLTNILNRETHRANRHTLGINPCQ